MLPVDDDEALVLLGAAVLPPLVPVEPARFIALDGGNGCLVVVDEYVGIAAG